jgi:crotonobetainyl-CoA:carnitine CoA-transferase CaiB-like acyl-CoA transferase
MNAERLAGVKVAEAATFVSGPFATLMLQDLGAEVVKVEGPTGDPTYRFGITHDGVGAMAFNVNRGKRSERIDLKSSEGRRRMDALLADADVFVHNWRPGVAERLGLDPVRVCDQLPALVYVSISGFGDGGPRAGGPVFDSLLQAACGMAAYEGDGDVPRLARSYLADKVAAMFATQAVLTGLLHRHETGRGGAYEISMLDAMAYFNFPDAFQHRTFLDHQPPLPQERNRPVRAADGWIVVAPVRGAQIAATASALGHPEWVAELKSAPSAAASVELLLHLMEPVVMSLTTAECSAVFARADVPAEPVLDLDGHLADEQVQHRDLYRIIDSHVGPARMVRHPLACSVGAR